MDKMYDYINKKTDNAFSDIKIPEMVYSKTTGILTIRLVYNKSRETITHEEKITLKDLINEFLNSTVDIDLRIKKALMDEDVVKEYVYKYVQINYSSVASNFSKNDIEVIIDGENVNVNVSFNEVFYDFLRNKYFDVLLTDHLSKNFFENFKITLNKTLKGASTTSVLENRKELIRATLPSEEVVDKYVEVENVTEFIGNICNDKPYNLKGLKTPAKGLTTAGKIRFITKRSFTSKQKDDEGNFIQKDYFSFSLSDDSSKSNLSCVFFINVKDIEKFEELQEGTFVIVNGDLEKFNERINFKVRNISLADPIFKEEVIEVIPKKQENEKYLFVKPEPYIMLEQADLFSLSEDKVNNFLRDNVVVVFDFETTGLDSSSNEIIEIGAVKVVNGKIIETFSTFVKPKEEISEEITSITGITNEMVKDAYNIQQILPDFYKFTRGAVLTAYNISFDYNFLYAASKNTGYVFDNRQIDTMYLARTKLLGLKNYRLKTVATSLNIPLDNAHRAIYDTIATAEVFIKLSDDLK